MGVETAESVESPWYVNSTDSLSENCFRAFTEVSVLHKAA